MTIITTENKPEIIETEKDEPKKIIVEIEKWEYERANAVGIARCVANWGSPDAAHYKQTERQEDNRTASVAAALCELAVAKLTNSYWHGHVWHWTERAKYRDLPDVGKNTEVRRLRTSSFVPIRKGQNKKENLKVFGARVIGLEMNSVQVYGYILQKKGWEIGVESNYGKNPEDTRLVHISKLKIYEG